jgi:hypothetical protein
MPLAVSRSLFASGGSISAEALSTWARAATPAGSEARWILVPVSGRLIAMRVEEANGAFSLQSAWTSNDLTTPATPIIVNGVVFALSTGRPAAGRAGSTAVLYAYDGFSGKALWNSGKSMTSVASPGSYWSALSQVYVGAEDGTVYAFGFADDRR